MTHFRIILAAFVVFPSVTMGGDPPKVLGQLCGVLGPGPQGCAVVEGFDGRTFAIENTGDFTLGETVYVSGTLVENSTLCTPVTLPAIEDNSIEPCFAGCGTLQIGPQGCTLFVPNDGSAGFVLANLGDAEIGDRIYVEGPIRDGALACFPFEAPLIDDNLVFECFSSCGVIVVGIVCNAFIADSGEVFPLSNYGGFNPGERVFVTGGLEPDSPYCFPIPQVGVRVAEIGACGVGPDLNGDGIVDGADLAALLSAFGPCPAPLVSPCLADLNGDGIVNGSDLAALLSAWGPLVQ